MWGKKGADFYLLDQTHGRHDFPATIQQIRALNDRAKHAVNAVLVEDKANGSAVLSVLKKEIPGMIAINPEGGKEGRAAAVAPMIEAGNVLLPMPEEQPWVEDTLLEFVTFPAAKHDDRVDSASQALLWLLSKRQSMQLFPIASIGWDGDSPRSQMRMDNYGGMLGGYDGDWHEPVPEEPADMVVDAITGRRMSEKEWDEMYLNPNKEVQ